MSRFSLLAGLFTLSLGVAWVILLAAWTLARLPRRSASLDLLNGLVLALVWATALLLILGNMGGLRRWVFIPVTLAGILLLWGWGRDHLRSARQRFGEDFAPLPRWLKSHPLYASVLGISTLALVVRAAVHVWFLPPYVYDTLTYHLPKVADWIQTGWLVARPTPVVRSFWPANFEVLQAGLAACFHHDVLVEAAGLPFYGLAVGSVYSVARNLDLRPAWAAGCAMVFAWTPALVLHAVCGKNDIVPAAIFLYLAAQALDARRHGWGADRLALGAVALGLAAGAKPYVLVLVPGLLFLPGCPRPARDRLGPRGAPAWRTYALLGLLAIGLGSYWYARNIVLFRNPLYPVEFRFLGRTWGESGGNVQQGSLRFDALRQNGRELVRQRIFDRAGRYQPDLHRMAGWGWFSFACGLPGLGYALLFRRRLWPLAAAWCIALTLLLSAVRPDPWNLRFALWFPALFAWGFGVAASGVSSPAVRANMVLLAMLCTGLNAAGTLDNGHQWPEDWRRLAHTPVAERSVMPALQNMIARHVPPGVTLGYFVNPNDLIYPFYGPDLRRPVEYLAVPPAASFAAQMQTQGLRYAYIRVIADRAWQEGFDHDLTEGRLHKVEGRLFERTEASP